MGVKENQLPSATWFGEGLRWGGSHGSAQSRP